jgi:hypothetical protein
MNSRLKTIAAFSTPEDAEVARIALENEGIASYLEGATTVGMLWHCGNAVGGVKLQVAEGDAQRACEVLAREKVSGEDGTAEAGVCPKCGADLPPGFEVCWSCESPAGDGEAASSSPTAAPSAQEAGEKRDDDGQAAEGDATAWRALSAAIIGVFLCPPLLHFYSIWVLLKLTFQRQPLSRKGNRNYYLAMFVDAAACFVTGLFFAIMSSAHR